jgi:uncharacterized protein YbjT (DUF2867 family)
MKRVLIVGATGQLGTRVFEKLMAGKDYTVRIFAREDASNLNYLKQSTPEITFGDLTDKRSFETAVAGCDFIISTANTAAPRKKTDTFQSVDIQGYLDLINAAKSAGVRQFIYTSIAPMNERFNTWIPLMQSKTITETFLKSSGLNYTIIQPCAFMDIYFSFMGTDKLSLNEPSALTNRPWGFLQTFYSSVKNDMAKGKFDIIGNGQNKQSYITIDNVADFLIKSIDNQSLFNKTIPLGGPEALTSLEVKSIFEKTLNKPLTVKSTPAVMMKIMGNVFSLFNKPASNILKLNYANAVSDLVVDSTNIARELDIKLTSAEEYIKSKILT